MKMLDNVLQKVHIRKDSASDRRYSHLEASSVDRISDEELLAYTGKTRDQLHEWASHQPGVAGNPPAKASKKPRLPGLRGYESVNGYSFWGWA
jgi:hypothetical protein